MGVPRRAVAAEAAWLAALNATVLPLAIGLAQHLRQRRRRGSDDECAATWRAYDGEPSRWRPGWPHRWLGDPPPPNLRCG